MIQNEKNTKMIQLCLAIEYNRQQLEFLLRDSERDNSEIDDCLNKLIQLESHLADLTIEEYLKRGA
jgi:DNA polymerase III delta prime subunit